MMGAVTECPIYDGSSKRVGIVYGGSSKRVKTQEVCYWTASMLGLTPRNKQQACQSR
jgi:hypothetical protein